MTQPNTGAQLPQTLINVLHRHGLPMTTTELREHIDELSQAAHPIVAERIYRSLLVLQRRGKVRRVYLKPSRHAHWLLTCAGAADAAAPNDDIAQAQ